MGQTEKIIAGLEPPALEGLTRAPFPPGITAGKYRHGHHNDSQYILDSHRNLSVIRTNIQQKAGTTPLSASFLPIKHRGEEEPLRCGQVQSTLISIPQCVYSESELSQLCH